MANYRLVVKLHRMAAANDWRGAARVAKKLGPGLVDAPVAGHKFSALAHAVAAGNSRVVRVLLEGGADPLQDPWFLDCGYPRRGTSRDHHAADPESLETSPPCRLLLDAIDGLAIRTAAELIVGGADRPQIMEHAARVVRVRLKELKQAAEKAKDESGVKAHIGRNEIYAGAYIPHFTHSHHEEVALRRLQCLFQAPAYAGLLTNGFIEMPFERAGRRDESLRIVQRVAAQKLDGVDDITTIGR